MVERLSRGVLQMLRGPLLAVSLRSTVLASALICLFSETGVPAQGRVLKRMECQMTGKGTNVQASRYKSAPQTDLTTVLAQDHCYSDYLSNQLTMKTHHSLRGCVFVW